MKSDGLPWHDYFSQKPKETLTPTPPISSKPTSNVFNKTSVQSAPTEKPAPPSKVSFETPKPASVSPTVAKTESIVPSKESKITPPLKVPPQKTSTPKPHPPKVPILKSASNKTPVEKTAVPAVSLRSRTEPPLVIPRPMSSGERSVGEEKSFSSGEKSSSGQKSSSTGQTEDSDDDDESDTENEVEQVSE